MEELPIWLQPVTLGRWPVHPVESAELRYRIGIPEAWQATPTVAEGFNEVEHRYTGALAAEQLSVSFMADADPGAPLREWVASMIAMVGSPVALPQMEMLAWDDLGENDALKQRLRIDEAHLYTGLGELQENGRPTLARLYGVLARRDRFAWKMILMFSSACLPDAEEDMIARNDHVRAGAVLGQLAFM